MNEKFQKILDDIKKSSKMVEILQNNEQATENLHNRYSINPDSLLGLLLENTGGLAYPPHL